MEIVDRLKYFLETEARSCSMDFGCVTPLYVYRMLGGVVALEAIEAAMAEIKFPGRWRIFWKPFGNFIVTCLYLNGEEIGYSSDLQVMRIVGLGSTSDSDMARCWLILTY